MSMSILQLSPGGVYKGIYRKENQKNAGKIKDLKRHSITEAELH